MITIRKAALKDLEAVRSLNQELFNHDSIFDNTLNLKWPLKNKNYYRKAITKKGKITFVAILDEKIVGYLIASIQKIEEYRTIKKIAELENTLVLEKSRGQGIGSLLTKEFFKWAKSQKVTRVKVMAYAENSEAIRFYQKNGFKNYSLTLEGDI